LEPQRAAAGAKAHPTAIYAQESSAGTGLTTTRPGESAKPLFYGLPLAEETGDNAAIASLYEYRHSETHQRQYSTNPALRQKGWIRTAQPLCRVWKAPPGPLLLDRDAKPNRSTLSVLSFRP
jgi:hypothetical protein